MKTDREGLEYWPFPGGAGVELPNGTAKRLWDWWWAPPHCSAGDYVPTSPPLLAEKAPGIPDEKDGYRPPKNWDGKNVRNPNGRGAGYPDDKGRVWIPTDHNGTHAPHWDVQDPQTGDHEPIYPK